ncbi:acyl-CoA N-acyltransferase, partial [Calocera cornea HHB12733]
AGTLWVCDRCFKYMKNASSHEHHFKTCHLSHPPGRKVYQKGALTIWEVDGALSKLFCQNLSLFGKLFIDVKEIYFDVEPFMFYLLTDGDPKRDHVLGFFSKEKVSYDNNNLACIITFPPYQKRGYGMLMIEFSYELSRRDGVFGSPERPLSESGVRTYLAFWISMLVRHMRLAFEVPGSPTRSGTNIRRWKNTKGWDGELPRTRARAGALPNGSHQEDPFAGRRTISGLDVSVKISLQDLAQATYIRPEDIAMALNECSLLKRQRTMGTDSHAEIIISQRDLERVAETYHVKPQFLHLDHVML